MLAYIVEHKLAAQELVPEGFCDIDLTGRRFSHGACCEIDNGSADVSSSDLDLARVDTYTNLNARLIEESLQIHCGPDGSGRCIERGEDSIACQLDQLAIVRTDRVACDPVVAVEPCRPGMISSRE